MKVNNANATRQPCPGIIHVDAEKGWRGGQQQAWYLYTQMLNLGCPTLMVCRTGSKFASRLQAAKLPYATLPLKADFDIISGYRLARLAKKHNCSILQLHSARAVAIGALAKLFYPALKLVATRRVDFHLKKNIFSKLKYGAVTRHVGISKNVVNIMLADGISQNKISLIHSAIDITRLANDAPDTSLRQLPGWQNSIIIGTVAALAGHKDYPNLLKAASIALKTNPNLRFVSIGDGKDKPQLLELHQQLNLGDNFVFLGYRNDVGSLLKALDIFVLASKKEGLGTSVLDALAAGLPVIGTKAGGIPEMIEPGVNGLLVPAGNPADLANAFLKLADDTDLRKRLATAAPKTAARFDYRQMTQKYIELYNSL